MVSSPSSLGELHFKLKYSYEKRSLSVVIVRAEGLPPVKGEGSVLDPYVKLQLLPEKQHKVFFCLRIFGFWFREGF